MRATITPTRDGGAVSGALLASWTFPDVIGGASAGIGDLDDEAMFAAWDRSTPTYRTHRVHPHVQLWFVEGRDFRSPNKMPDGPEKSIWGEEQREWLQSTLKASVVTVLFRVVVVICLRLLQS